MPRKKSDPPVEAAPGIPAEIAEAIHVDESPTVASAAPETPTGNEETAAATISAPAVAPPVAAAPPIAADVTTPDAGVVLYRDRAAPPRTADVSEGRANFATITNAARGIAPDAPEGA